MSRYLVNPLFSSVMDPPVAEVRSWVAGRRFATDKPLIDVAQAVPGYPPPSALTEHLATVAKHPETARYTEIVGLEPLRQALAEDLTRFYGGAIDPEEVLITAGCNQAFCLALMALARAGDQVLLPLPYYFNHRMWLELLGVEAVHLAFRPDLGGAPDPGEVRSRITDRTRALVLVTPNNPTGAVCPPALLEELYDLAQEHGIALVLDETYRDFLPAHELPHSLFRRCDWSHTLVHLYSFSKVYSLTGYRVGSVVCGRELRREITKALDCVSICAPRMGQEAALFGLRELDSWRREKRRLLDCRVEALRGALRSREELRYEIQCAGGYFAYLRHPFSDRSSLQVARRLADEQALLVLPGSMFGPDQEAYLRLAFGNVEEDKMSAIAERLLSSQRTG